MSVTSTKPAKSALRLALLSVALLVAVGASGAQAYVAHSYCGVLIKPQEFCGSGGAHPNLQGNIAWYGGNGNLTVCQEVFDNSTSQFKGYSCGVNAAGSVNNYSGLIFDSLTPFVQNDSTVNAHTVNGDWYSP